MNPGLNFSINLAPFTAARAVPHELAAHLAGLCATLNALYDGQPTDLASFPQDLSALGRWLTAPAPGGPAHPDWTAEVVSFPAGAGGQAVLRDAQQALTLSLDSSGKPLFGLWQSQRPGEEQRAFTFQVENQTLLLDDGQRQSRHVLPGAQALSGWGSLAAFAGHLLGLFATPEEATPASPSPRLPAQPAPPAPPPTPAFAAPQATVLHASQPPRPARQPAPPPARPHAASPQPSKPVSPTPPARPPVSYSQPSKPIPPAPAPAWYYLDQAGQRAGPVDAATLQRWVMERRLRPDTMVWNQSLANWVEIQRSGLISQAPAQPVQRAAPAWYYLDRGAQTGPIEESVLRRWLAERRLPPDTLVWNPALPGWVKASQAGLI